MAIIGGKGLAAALALSRFGERIGSQALIYNPGVFYLFFRVARLSAPVFADAVCSVFGHVKTVADIGCGAGGYSAELQRRGLEVYAGEYARLGRTIARLQGVKARPFDVTKPETAPTRTFDLGFSLEVAEHIPSSLADAFVDYMVAVAPLLVVTAAKPGQGGQRHVNEQPKTYWIEKFAARAYALDDAAARAFAERLKSPKIPSFLHENVMIFRGTPRPMARRA